MNVLIVLITISLLLGAGAIFAFVWAIETDQFEPNNVSEILDLKKEETKSE